jgi:formylglycine-generating enzyme required for sulfatase activity
LSWNDAVAFCHWLSEKEGKKYRLPTEAEWEYCCRAGTTTRFTGGNSPNDLVRYGNVFDEGAKAYLTTMKVLPGLRDGYGFPAPVGRYRANAFGIYDMHGNVWEYCSDWYSDNYYASSPTDDPQGPAQGVYRVLRGGGWNGDPVLARSSDRFRFRPDQCDSSSGFRVVREP